MIDRNTVRMGIVAIVAVALARWATGSVPVLSRFQGKV